MGTCFWSIHFFQTHFHEHTQTPGFIDGHLSCCRRKRFKHCRGRQQPSGKSLRATGWMRSGSSALRSIMLALIKKKKKRNQERKKKKRLLSKLKGEKDVTTNTRLNQRNVKYVCNIQRSFSCHNFCSSSSGEQETWS